MAQYNITINDELLKGLFLTDGKDKAFKELLEQIFNQVLLAQSTDQLQAQPYERSDDRTAYRNGLRERNLTTRIGTLTLKVPRHRNGNFSTELFNSYQRSEQALILSMMEMVVNGVSTRKVQNITEELCGEKFSKSTVSNLCRNLDQLVEAFKNRPLETHYPFVMIDALYIKTRIEGRVQSRGLLIAVGINKNGNREVIGLQLQTQNQKQVGETSLRA